MYHSVSLHKGLYFHSIKGTEYNAQTNSHEYHYLGSSKQICEHYHLHLSSIHDNSFNIIDVHYICLPDHEKMCIMSNPKNQKNVNEYTFNQ